MWKHLKPQNFQALPSTPDFPPLLTNKRPVFNWNTRVSQVGNIYKIFEQ